ncbi:MAG TPA: hypothetical protein VKY66_05170, partial [Protaetiibacter sp.]|nr:hypothetical protein [Protaetiibacter sp.]
MPTTTPRRSPRHRTRIAVAALATAVLALLPAVLVAPAAAAATPGISAQVLHNGAPLGDGDVVREGDTIVLKVQYDTRVTPGAAHTFRLGGAVTLQGVPPGNAAIASVTQDAGDPELVTVTFRDPWPADVNQGVFELEYVVAAVSHTGPAPVTWAIDGDPDSIDVVVRNDGDQPAELAQAWSKAVSPGNRDNRLSVAIDPVTGLYALTIDPALASDEFAYTLRIETDSAAPQAGYAVTDALPEGFGYVGGSFEVRTTTWDSSGWNMTTSPWAPWSPDTLVVDPAAGDSFTGTVDLPAMSITELRYRAAVADWPLVRDRVQASFDTRPGAPGPGSFSTSWTNTASFGPSPEVTRTATFGLR